MDQEAVLFNKEGFRFIRIMKNQYKLDFSIQNERIIIANILDFNLIKLIYDLNPDVYEYVNIEKINENLRKQNMELVPSDPQNPGLFELKVWGPTGLKLNHGKEAQVRKVSRNYEHSIYFHYVIQHRTLKFVRLI